jgi:large subunit ribosomal protein L24
MKVKKGDKVIIITGRDRSKIGSVLKVFPKTNSLLIEGLNLITRHVKPKRSGEKGQKIKVPTTITVSNVQLVCARCKKPTKITYQTSEKKKIRICKKCKSSID